MRRALEEYRILGVKTNIPFHQQIMESYLFFTGRFDTRFVEERFSMDEKEEGKEDMHSIAAVMATLMAHKEGQLASQIIRQSERDTSNWKWVGRWERMQR
jgi:acetyl/propionyl-CoA carboxylase alpha subunit